MSSVGRGGGGGGSILIRDIMMHVGGYYEYRGGKIFTIVTPVDPSGTAWSVIHVWDPPLKQLP